ncbi:MAG TPA: DNA-directed RNA polymerase subunit B'' [Candidatus Nanopusillus sp.]|nr:DNA-directed RNA polymerase subunit B'' [Candidatus Nanopusillus sp.]
MFYKMRNSDKYLLFYKYFEEHGVLETQIESFNYFADVEMTEIVKEVGEVEPKILPPGIKDLKIRFEKAWLSKADYIEKEGIPRIIYPNEARIRNITYSGSVYVEFSAWEDGTLKTKYVVNIGRLPIMVKSKYCNLYGLSEEELIKLGEDPYDPGSYFIINGTERVLVMSEELATNKFYVEEGQGPVKYRGFIFSEAKAVSIPHRMELLNDGIVYLTFGKFKRIPVIPIVKALGLTIDADIAKLINEGDNFEETYINLYEFIGIQDQEQAMLWLANKLKFTGGEDIKKEKVRIVLDNYLLPHIGTSPKDRAMKAYNLLKMVKKLLLLTHGKIEEDIKDHFMNKVVRLPGELLRDLFRVVFRTVVNDAMHQYHRLARRGKVPSLTSIFRSKLFTERFGSAMGTGQWTRNRTGVSQLLDRTNKLAVLSHLTRVWSSIPGEAELLEARMVHGTHWGRLDLIETPEGKNTGLRKNLTLLAKITFQEAKMGEIVEKLKEFGLKPIKTEK